jgi:hypothetical protein
VDLSAIAVIQLAMVVLLLYIERYWRIRTPFELGNRKLFRLASFIGEWV